jgi:hypothetical protein
MRGQEQLIAMRKAGKKPRSVQIFVGHDPSEEWRDWHEVCARHAEIEIADDDFLSSLDLRFVVGLAVFVFGACHRRVKAIHDACVGQGAERVVSGVTNGSTTTHVFDSVGAA